MSIQTAADSTDMWLDGYMRIYTSLATRNEDGSLNDDATYIDGDSQDKYHTNWIEINNYNYKMTHAIDDSVLSSSAIDRVKSSCGPLGFSVFEVHKLIDRASPQLIGILTGGQQVPRIDIEIRDQNATDLDYSSRYILLNCFIQSIETVGQYWTPDYNLRNNRWQIVGIGYSRIIETYQWLNSEGNPETSSGGADKTTPF